MVIVMQQKIKLHYWGQNETDAGREKQVLYWKDVKYELLSNSKYKLESTALMCVACKPLVLVVHLSKEPFQLRTPLETCLIVGLGVLGGEMGGGGILNYYVFLHFMDALLWSMPFC